MFPSKNLRIDVRAVVSSHIDSDVFASLSSNPPAMENFLLFPPLYQRIRVDNVQRYRNDRRIFGIRLKKLVEASSLGVMHGE